MTNHICVRLRAILFLQLIIQMQIHLADSDSSSSVFRKPEHILSFVKQALVSVTAVPVEAAMNSCGLHSPFILTGLRTAVEDERLSEGEDSDDERPRDVSSSDEEMTETALNLLLALLESMSFNWMVICHLLIIN
jgi:hypothetical protein